MVETTGFAILGTLFLIYMVWQDHKNNMWVDDRKNAFMMGAAISLAWITNNSLLWALANIIISIFLALYLKRFNVFGEADINALRWSFIGFGILGFNILVWYLGLFLAFTLIYMVVKKVMRIKTPTPFMIVIFFAFVCNSILFGLY